LLPAPTAPDLGSPVPLGHFFPLSGVRLFKVTRRFVQTANHIFGIWLGVNSLPKLQIRTQLSLSDAYLLDLFPFLSVRSIPDLMVKHRCLTVRKCHANPSRCKRKIPTYPQAAQLPVEKMVHKRKRPPRSA
jgi:hypothetical protein